MGSGQQEVHESQEQDVQAKPSRATCEWYQDTCIEGMTYLYCGLPFKPLKKCPCNHWKPKQEPVASDPINHPPHYTRGQYEVVDVILDWQLDYLTGSCVKYIGRHQWKGQPLEDLRKARWFLTRAIEELENNGT